MCNTCWNLFDAEPSVQMFLLEVAPRMITCTAVAWKPAGTRLFAGGNNMAFYIKGSTAGIVDKLANVVMNKAIELRGTTRGVTLERNARAPKKIDPRQRKIL